MSRYIELRAEQKSLMYVAVKERARGEIEKNSGVHALRCPRRRHAPKIDPPRRAMSLLYAESNTSPLFFPPP